MCQINIMISGLLSELISMMDPAAVFSSLSEDCCCSSLPSKRSISSANHKLQSSRPLMDTDDSQVSNCSASSFFQEYIKQYIGDNWQPLTLSFSTLLSVKLHFLSAVFAVSVHFRLCAQYCPVLSSALALARNEHEACQLVGPSETLRHTT